MYIDMGPWSGLQAWQVTLVDIVDGSRIRSRLDVRLERAGFAVFMRDLYAADRHGRSPGLDEIAPEDCTGAPWSMLRRANSEYYRLGKTIVSGCFVVCTEGGLIRAAYSDFPGGFVKARSGSIRRLAGGGAPLGLFPDGDFPESVCLLDAGEAAMFINGGVAELVAGGHTRIADLFARRPEAGTAKLPSLPAHAATAVIIRRVAHSPLVAPRAYAHAAFHSPAAPVRVAI